MILGVTVIVRQAFGKPRASGDDPWDDANLYPDGG